MIDKFSHGFINSVYKFNDFTLNELICKLAQKMDEVITQANESFNYLEWLKEQGLPDEVIKIMLEWKEDGTLESLINEVLLQDINTKVDTIKTEVDSFKTEVTEQLDTKTTNIISTKAFSTLQQTINMATELGINKVYVDRDFDEEITLNSNIELFSNGNTIKKIKANGNRGNLISHSGVNKNYINTSQLQSGDIIIIDLNVGGLSGQGKYREINKVLYVNGNKAYLENDTLFDYPTNTRVIKINTVKNIKLTNIKVLDFNFNICEDIVFNDVTLLHSGSLAMCYKITGNVLKVKSQKDNESRLDIFSCSRDITINTLISEGGNTESDNSNIKLNQVANVNIDNLILKSAYKPKNVYGHDGYFHNFMIDGAISELIDYIGDDVAYPNYPSKHININNVVLSGGANTYYSIFLTVVEDVNINNLINIKTLALKEFKNIRINNLSADMLHLEGNNSDLFVNNAKIKTLNNLNNIINVKFSNCDIKEMSGNNNNTNNVKFSNCDLYYQLINDGSSNIENWSIENSYVKELKLIDCGAINMMLNNVNTDLLYLNGCSNIIGENVILNNANTPLNWLQNITNVNIKGMIKNEGSDTQISNGGGIGYNVDIIFKALSYKKRVSSFLINIADIGYWQTQKFFKYGDIVENRDPSNNQPQRWICIDTEGTLVPLDKIGYQFK